MGTYRLTKEIPPSRLQAYTNLGWILDAQYDDSASIRKEVMTSGNAVDSTDIAFVQPYLCQRGLIRRPLGKHVEDTLTQAVQLEFMGAAQFERGALERSLRRVESQFLLYKKIVGKGIIASSKGREFDLRLLANFDTPERESQYLQMLHETFLGKRYSNEKMGVEILSGDKIMLTGTADFWWDIKNDVFFSFDKQFMARIQNHLQASFAQLNS